MAVHCCLAALGTTHKSQLTSLKQHGLVRISAQPLPTDISINILLCIMEDHYQPFKCDTCQVWVLGQNAGLAHAAHLLSEHMQETPMKCLKCEAYDMDQEGEVETSCSPMAPPPPPNPMPKRRWRLRGSP